MANLPENPETKSPSNLYELCLISIVEYVAKFQCARDKLKLLPHTIVLDAYVKMRQLEKTSALSGELGQLGVFDEALRYGGSQLKLLQCFQAVADQEKRLPSKLALCYLIKTMSLLPCKGHIELGLRLGGFLNEAGWYEDAESVLVRCRTLCRNAAPTPRRRRFLVDCSYRLLNTQWMYCSFAVAESTCREMLSLLGLSAPPADRELRTRRDLLAAFGPPLCTAGQPHMHRVSADGGCGSRACSRSLCSLLARALKEVGALCFARCEYAAAEAWCSRAFALLTPHTPVRTVVDVVRGLGKACVVRRRFAAAGRLARQAAVAARDHFGPSHHRYAAALNDLGFYLLNVDSIQASVAVYEEALDIMRGVFGASSLHVATAQEDLAYALYVLEYSSGRFFKARENADHAIQIIEEVVPANHLLLASAKRVKALILEEIALDAPQGHEEGAALLRDAERLHRAALELSVRAFGENNVQTAKHYGNLGRLYQSMNKYQEAEKMHLKAIAIKEALLGPEDYEVGLSVGHLASLYNYHMDMHSEAEQLYARSIAINLKLFGESYSGLEYDYRGLVHVFTQLKRHSEAEHYDHMLREWRRYRAQMRMEQEEKPPKEKLLTIDELRAEIFPLLQ